MPRSRCGSHRDLAIRARPFRLRPLLGLTLVLALTGALLATGQAAGAQTPLFEDGFESGDLTTGGWASTGAATTDGRFTASGQFAALVDDDGSLTKTVSTRGFTDITLAYARYTYGYDAGEQLNVEWSTDGTNWSLVDSYSSSGWATNQVALPAGADDQATLMVRFRSNANGFLERFRVDDVSITGVGDGAPAPTTPPTTTPAADCLPPVGDYTDDGPFAVSTDDVGRVNMWIPQGLPADCRVPVVHVANGTGARCSIYGAALRFFASHGFIASCYEDTNTGQGTQAIEAVNAVIERYPDLVDTRYGFTGHSQGGGGAILAVHRAEQEWGDNATYAALGAQPAHGFGDSPSNYRDLYAQIDSPVAMFNGSSDFLVSASWVGRGYDALSGDLEKAWFEAVGAPHIPVPNGETAEMGLA